MQPPDPAVCFSPCHQVDCVTVKGSKIPMDIWTFDISDYPPVPNQTWDDKIGQKFAVSTLLPAEVDLSPMEGEGFLTKLKWLQVTNRLTDPTPCRLKRTPLNLISNLFLWFLLGEPAGAVPLRLRLRAACVPGRRVAAGQGLSRECAQPVRGRAHPPAAQRGGGRRGAGELVGV